MKKRTNKNRKSPAKWAEENAGLTTSGKPQEYSIEATPYQQIMDRMEGRILCYQNAAYNAKGGQKLYTRAQIEGIKAKAFVEAKMIVWMYYEPPTCSNCDCVMPNVPPDRCGMCGCPAEHQSKRIAAGTADEKPDGQAEND